MENQKTPNIPNFFVQKWRNFSIKKKHCLKLQPHPTKRLVTPTTTPECRALRPACLNAWILVFYLCPVCVCVCVCHFRATHCARCSRAPPPLLLLPISRLLFCSLLDLSSFKESILKFSIKKIKSVLWKIIVMLIWWGVFLASSLMLHHRARTRGLLKACGVFVHFRLLLLLPYFLFVSGGLFVLRSEFFVVVEALDCWVFRELAGKSLSSSSSSSFGSMWRNGGKVLGNFGFHFCWLFEALYGRSLEF